MPPRRTTPKGYQRARELRKEPSLAENKLWALLRNRQFKGIGFRRQHAIGVYIVDFCAPRQKLVIELDGSQHLDQQEYDTQRSEYLEGLGYQVIRFWNNEVLNDIEGVFRVIDKELK